MSTALKPVSDLSDLLANPERVSEVPLDAIPVLRGRLKELDTRLEIRIATAHGDGQPERADGDRLLDVKQAAARLGMKPATLYRRSKTDTAIRTLVVDNGTRKLLFSEQRIGAFLRRRTGR